MFKILALVGLGGLFGLSGCTLTAMNRDSDAREHRIPVKQQQLYNEDEHHRALTTERQQLESQRSLIRGKEAELNGSLERSSQQIAQMKTATRQQKRKQQDLQARVRKITADKQALQAQPDTDAKQRKLEALKKEADQLLGLPFGEGSPK